MTFPSFDKPLQVSLELPLAVDAPRRAREVVEQLLGELPEQQRFEVRLLVTELVTNALRHAEGGATLSLSVDGGTLLVNVHDHSDALPVPREPDPDSDHGRGLMIVDKIAEEWGAEPASDSGKRVWAKVALRGHH